MKRSHDGFIKSQVDALSIDRDVVHAAKDSKRKRPKKLVARPEVVNPKLLKQNVHDNSKGKITNR
jgi:hypothetical protein